MHRFLVFAILMLSGCVFAGGEVAAQQNQVAIEFYGRWSPHPKLQNIHYCPFFYKTTGAKCFEHHYVIWNEKKPNVCFCYNPRKRTYWGRWNYSTTQVWTFYKVVEIRVDAGPPQDLVYEMNPSRAFIPMTQSVMSHPLDLPNH